MVVREGVAQPKGAESLVQARHARIRAWLAAPCLAGLLSGCTTMQSFNPVNWWHGMQGGKIAEQRPPPPGADDAYPNLASVPARPAPPDRVAMRKLTDALVADRTNAQHTAAAAPLPDPSSPSASPGLFGAGTLRPPPPPPPPGQEAMSASLPAVSAAPAPPPRPAATAETAPPPARAPVPAVQSTPLDNTPPPTVTPAPFDQMPPLPAQPPPRPGAAPSPPPPAASGPASAPAPGAGTSIVFASGSAALSPAAADAVKAFAARRGASVVSVTGHGDAASSDPAAQNAAVSLGLSRAQAVANALAASGVPASAIRVGAEAGGRGASLRLLQ